MTLKKKQLSEIEAKHRAEHLLEQEKAMKQTVLEHLAERRKRAEQELADVHTAAAQAQALGIADMPYHKVYSILQGGKYYPF